MVGLIKYKYSVGFFFGVSWNEILFGMNLWSWQDIMSSYNCYLIFDDIISVL